jgi:hypothetical protein
MMRPFLITFLVSLCAATLHAQQPAGPDLSTAAKEAAKAYRPVAREDIASSQADAEKAIRELDAFLKTGAASKSIGWKRYLQWDELNASVRGGQATGVIGTAIEKLRANHKGLERPEFLNLQNALARHATNLRAAANAKSADEYPKRLAELAANLEAYQKDPSSGDSALAIGRTLAWLDEARQTPELISSIRGAYSHSNFFGHASRRFAAFAVERDIDQLAPVHDNILGTSLHGTARMVGHTSLVLDENPNAASLNILLNGTIWSNNIGYNGPVTIHTTGTTSVSARKNIKMDAAGLLAFAAAASAGTRSNINSISARCGLIERIAWKKAGQQKGQAEAIGSQHAGGRVAGQMDAEAGRMITEKNADYQEKFRNPLLRRGEFPEELVFSSTRDRVQLQSKQESVGLIAAPNAPPSHSGERDLAARMHESAVINYGEGVLGGYELTDIRLEKLIKDDLKADLPEELRVTNPDGTIVQEKDPWSITFSKSLPVRARFNNNGIWIAIRADGFTRGEGDTPDKYKPALSELVEISAQYQLDKTARGATMRREGDVRVRFPNRPNPDQVNVRDNPIVTFIRRKFRSLFKEEFVGDGLIFKGDLSRAGRLQLAEIAADGAWLTLGWDMTGEGATAPITTPAGGE